MIQRLSHLATAALLAVALGLTACSGADNTSDGSGDRAPAADSDRLPPDQDPEMKTEQPESESPSEETSEETPSEEPTEEEPTETPTIPNPDPLPDVTKPGTVLEPGQSAIVAKGGVGGDNGSAYLEVTITSVEEGDQQILEDLKDKGPYEGGTVYYVRGRLKVLALIGEAVDAPLFSAAVTGVQEDGQGTGGIFSVSSNPDCKGNFVVNAPTVGAETESCTVALAVPGKKAVGAIYYGDSSVGTKAKDDPYWKDPVVWRLP